MVQLELIEGQLIRRYKRFLADCHLVDGGEVVAHCPNPGSMKTLIDGEPRVWLRHVPKPERKLKWTLTLIEVGQGGQALVDTSLPNGIVSDGILARQVPRIEPIGHLRHEVVIGKGSRLDIVLGDQPRPDQVSGQIFIEVKNVTMRSSQEPGRADFPDSVTARGRKHLDVLTTIARSGKRSVLFLLLGRTDCHRVGFACDIDPKFCEALSRAVEAGVEVVAHRISVKNAEITLGDEVEVDLPR